MPALLDDTSHGVLLKEQLASALKQVIVTGRLHAGQRVVETVWPQEFNVAQASVREAIDLPITEAFLVKDAGRSARVVNYREQDVTHIYEVRAVIEGLAAQLGCSNGSDLAGVEAALERMAIAAEERLMKELVQSDLDFHIALTRAHGNPVLAEIGAKLLFPLFAFIKIRVLTRGQGADAWIGNLPNHRLVLHVIREGNPILAGQFVQHCIRPFAASAYAFCENVEGSIEAHHKGQRPRGRKGLKTDA